MLFPKQELLDRLLSEPDSKAAETVLKNYFVSGYESDLQALVQKYPELKALSGVQKTFGTIRVGTEDGYVMRYWGEVDLEKLHRVLGTGKYVSKELAGETEVITAFGDVSESGIEFEMATQEA